MPVKLLRPENRYRTCIDEALDLVAPLAHNFERICRAHDVDSRAKWRICRAGRNLERGQVDKVGYSVFLDGAVQRVEIGDVSLDKMDLFQLFCIQKLLQTVRFGVEIINPELITALNQLA